MKRPMHLLGIVLVLTTILRLASPLAQAGRIGAPLYTTATVPAGMSVYFDIPFASGTPATVTINGNGSVILDLLMYDSDGHMAVGVGYWDRKVVSMNVYRTGVFRIEVRNLGITDDTFTLTTN